MTKILAESLFPKSSCWRQHNSLCVFKPKGYNIVNVPHGERDGLSPNGFSCWASWPHSPPLPSRSAGASRLASFRGFTYMPFPPTHWRAGEGQWGRQLNGSSCLDALALLPYPLLLIPAIFSTPLATNSSQCHVYVEPVLSWRKGLLGLIW